MPAREFKLAFGARCGLAGAIAIVVGCAAPARAEFSDGWIGGYQNPYFIGDPVQPRRVRRAPMPKADVKAEKAAAEAVKPRGPIVIAVSIQKQSMKIYDANGLFAQSPVSTGTASHPTPMGVFSIIEKHKWHRSNIYSGAPMPYMQRITWSGVAMHAGDLPGYPASHGCIRVPMSFAVKLWHYTRMGARVVVTPGEVTPLDIAHPTLASLRPLGPTANSISQPTVVRTADASGALPRVMVDASTPAASAPAPLEAISDDGASPAPANSAQLVPVLLPLRAETNLQRSETTDAEAANNPARAESNLEAALPAKLTGRVAIFVSRKDGKIYVRHNFAPVITLPITIAASDRPLGTHVFTARKADDDQSELVWSAVSLPSTTRLASLQDDKKSHRRRVVPVVMPLADNTAAEALDRIAIPAEITARLGMLPAGTSMVISDQSILAGETGEGTDFIVRLR